MSSKQEIRNAMKALEGAFQSDKAASECEAYWSGIEARDAFRNAGTVLLYMAIRGEIPTAGFIERWAGKKRIALPLVKGDTLELREYRPSKICKGYKGISEPTPEAPLISPEEIDFAIIPGVAFAPSGNGGFKRLGRGKGFYDRLLPLLHCPTVPAGYSFRFIEDLPTDSWDVNITG